MQMMTVISSVVVVVVGMMTIIMGKTKLIWLGNSMDDNIGRPRCYFPVVKTA